MLQDNKKLMAKIKTSETGKKTPSKAKAKGAQQLTC
jgi:hypothetical protein